MNLSNPFAKEEPKIQESVNVAGDCARVCLGMSQFARYRKEFETMEDNVLVEMVRLTRAYEGGKLTLEQYGTLTLAIMTKYQTVKILLSKVNVDAKKGQDA